MTEHGRIAIVFPGDPVARGTWSGTPAGLASGFEQLGFDVVRVDSRPHHLIDRAAFNAIALARTRPRGDGLKPALRRGRTVARISPEVATVRGLGTRRNLEGAGHLDAIVQIGTSYAIPAGPRVATFEDLTIPQALALEYPGWEQLSARAIARRKELQLRSYERATACCLSTSWAADSVVEDYGIAREKVHSVGLGRNSEPSAPPRVWSPPRLLFVGLDWEGKNGPGLLRAFARLREDVPEATLDIVGAHPPLDAPGVSGHGVLRMGDPDEKRRLQALFESATCFVVPSHREASAIAYLEAAAAGLPVIGSAAGGSHDLIGDGGCVVDPRDDDALVAALREFCRPEVAERVGAIGVERSSLFTWRAVAGRIVRALDLPQIDADELADFLQPARETANES